MISLRLLISALDLSINLSSLHAEYGISRSLVIRVSFDCGQYLEAESLLAQYANIYIEDDCATYFYGVISQVIYHGHNTDGYHYELKIESLLYPLTQQYHQRVFTQQSIPEIINTILNKTHFHNFTLQFKLRNNYSKLHYIPQYYQSDFEFLLECCNTEGIKFIFKHNKSHSTIIFYDHPPNVHSTKEIIVPTSKGLLVPDNIITALDYEIQQSKCLKIKIKTSHSELFPTQKIKIPEFKNICGISKFMIEDITHIANANSDHRYHNILTLVPLSTKIKKKNAKIHLPPHYCAALIKKTNKNKYAITMTFDRTQQTVSEISYQHAIGGEFQLPENTSVVVHHDHHNQKPPMIIGAIPSIVALSPVTKANASQTKLAMPNGHQWIMDDNRDAPYIKLKTANNMIELNQKKEEEYIRLQSEKGEVNISAKQSLRIECAENSNTVSSGDYKVNVKKDYLLASMSKGLHFQSGAKLEWSSKQNVHLLAEKEIHAYAAGGLELSAQKDFKCHIKNGGAYLAGQQGAFNIHATSIKFKNHAEGNVMIQAANVFIRINQHGETQFKCERLKIDAPEIMITGISSGLNSGAIVNASHHNISSAPPKVHASSDETLDKPIPLKIIHTNEDKQTNETSEEIVESALHAPIGLYYPASNDNPYFSHEVIGFSKHHLTEDEISYFQTHGNTATLFIHGFDLPYDGDANKITARTWWLHMEKNLNYAAGNLKAKDKKYKRILNVAWQGDPKHALDYMAAVAQAQKVGMELLPVIESLLSAGIKINIICHSLGAHVALHSMNALGKRARSEPLYVECISNVILWQAAVPDNIFSNVIDDKNIDDAYSFPYLTPAVKKIHVLYSRHDKVIGPIIVPMHFANVMHIESGSRLLNAIYKVIDWLNKKIQLPEQLTSIYAVANLLNQPLSYFINSHQHRIDFYRKWHHQYPRDRLNQIFKNNLDDQIKLIRAQYPDAYNYLSVALVAYMQGAQQALGDIINQRVRLSAHWLKVLSMQSENQDNYLYVKHDIANEIAALMMTMVLSRDAEPRPALGWHGVDDVNHPKVQQLISQRKLILHDQTPWLTKHSGMREPSEGLMAEVYKKQIVSHQAIEKL